MKNLIQILLLLMIIFNEGITNYQLFELNHNLKEASYSVNHAESSLTRALEKQTKSIGSNTDRVLKALHGLFRF